eukprot:365939-Chlamydomonas_euryale.AAC.3
MHSYTGAHSRRAYKARTWHHVCSCALLNLQGGSAWHPMHAAICKGEVHGIPCMQQFARGQCMASHACSNLQGGSAWHPMHAAICKGAVHGIPCMQQCTHE